MQENNEELILMRRRIINNKERRQNMCLENIKYFLKMGKVYKNCGSENISYLEKVFLKVIPNDSKGGKTLFPDFVIPGDKDTFVEHFQIDACERDENGGSSMIKKDIKEENDFIKESYKKEGSVFSKVKFYEHPIATKENLIKNLHSSLEKHLKEGRDKIKNKIFVVDLLGMICDSYLIPNIEKPTQKDFYECEKYIKIGENSDTYFALFDSEMLEFLKRYVERVDYIIFATNNNINIIYLRNLDERIKENKKYIYQCDFNCTQEVQYIGCTRFSLKK